jgi:hypothetical protein
MTIKLEVTIDEFNHIIAALSLMQDVDDDNGRPDDAKASRALIDRLQADRATQ